jgi:hypothetical protein
MRGKAGFVIVMAAAWALPAGAIAQERGSEPRPPVETAKDKDKDKDARKSSRSGKTSRSGFGSKKPADGVEIDVRSVPSGAAIAIDGEHVGKAPVKVRVAKGHRRIEASLRGYADADTALAVEPGMGYLVFSLARETEKPAEKSTERSTDKPVAKSGDDDAGKSSTPRAKSSMKHDDAMAQARRSLKAADHDKALEYAQAALDSEPGDLEAQMIATIAACGTGSESLARRMLPKPSGSYREISIRRCAGLGINLP